MKIQKVGLGIILLGIAGHVAIIHAEETNSPATPRYLFSTQRMSMEMNNPKLSTLSLNVRRSEEIENMSALEVYESKFEKNSRRFLNKFGPSSNYRWTRDLNRDSRHAYDRLTSSSADMFRGVLVDSARDAAVEYIPIEEWEERGRTFLALAGRFLFGTIGNTEQEQNEIISSAPSVYTVQYLDTKEKNDEGMFRQVSGLRLGRMNPYFYNQSSFGHYLDRPFIQNEIRLSGSLDPRKFGEVRIKDQIIIPTSTSSHFIFGASFRLNSNDSEDDGLIWSTRWEKKLVKNFFGSIGYSQGKQSLLLAMVQGTF